MATVASLRTRDMRGVRYPSTRARMRPTGLDRLTSVRGTPTARLGPTKLYYDPVAILQGDHCWYLPTEGASHGVPCEPITCVQFDGVRGREQRMACAGESGCVTISNPARCWTESVHTIARAENTIYDLCWSDQGRVLGTAMAGGICRLWNIERTLPLVDLTCFEPDDFHAIRLSFKTIRRCPGQPSLYLASSRDGSVSLFDIREARKTSATATNAAGMGHHVSGTTPVLRYANIHQPKHAPKLRKSRRSGLRPNVNHGVTSAVFGSADGMGTIYTSGASDGLVKAWDLRHFDQAGSPSSGSHGSKCPTPVVEFSEPPAERGYFSANTTPGTVARRPVQEVSGKRAHGVSSIDVDPTYTRLLVSYVYRSMVVYDLAGRGVGNNEVNVPTQYTTPQYSCKSFYVKSSWTSDGEYILSGSSDGLGYIFKRATSGTNTVLPSAILSAGTNENDDISTLAAPKTGNSMKDLELLVSASCESSACLKAWQLSSHIRRGKEDSYNNSRKRGSGGTASLYRTPVRRYRMNETNANT
jgi:WD40 repeat protein